LWTYFTVVFAVTWGIAAMALFATGWFSRTFGPLTGSNPMFNLAVYAPTLASIVLTGLFDGRAGLKALFARLNPARCHPGWYGVVIGGFLALPEATVLIHAQFGGPPPTWHWVGWSALATGLVLVPGPIGEELGWRGFALPRMLRHWSPAVASLILGLIWALWHLPAFYVSSLTQSQLSLPIFFLMATSLSVIMCWLFLKSKGSVLIAVLAHFGANNLVQIPGASFVEFTVGLTVVALVLIATAQLKPEPAAEWQAPIPGTTAIAR
jgi:hypothetical protein